MKTNKLTGEMYDTTNFLLDIQNPKECNRMPDGQWDVNFGYQVFGDIDCINHDTSIIKALHDIAKQQRTKRLYWYNTSQVRLVIEDWSRSKKYDFNGYIQRDKITSGALLIGLPVKIDPNNKSNNQIGLRLPSLSDL